MVFTYAGNVSERWLLIWGLRNSADADFLIFTDVKIKKIQLKNQFKNENEN